ncbi:MAG: YkgJ family cysteine cluster protein [Armatimonadetes bacterium]|nr:YkgJ family cysteine cluster protein [Armatimonadota bacterium]
MAFIFPEGQRFDCGSCTKCCRGAWNIHVDPASYEQVHGSGLYQKLEKAYGQPPMYMDEPEPGQKTALTLMHEGGCVFLDKDRLCSIHKFLGAKAKPLGCRQFPFVLRPTPDGTVVGVSFFCSAVQHNSGRPLPEHVEELEGLAKEYRHAGVGFRPISLYGDLTISWQSYKILEDMATSCLSIDDLRLGLWRVMVGTALSVGCLLRNGTTTPLASALQPTVSDEDLDRRLRAMPAVFVARDDVFESMERMFLIGIVGALESKNPEICKKNTEAIFYRGVVDSETFRCEIELKHFDDFRTRFDASWSTPHWKRYIDHLVFRKFLGLGRTVMANASALYMALPLLEFYRDLFAFVQNKLQPDLQDVYLAYDVVERGFTTHSRGMDPFFFEMADAFVNQVQQILKLQEMAS